MKNLLLPAIFLSCFLLLHSCNNNNSPSEEGPLSITDTAHTTVWLEASVNDLQIRAEPNLNANVLGKLKQGMSMEWKGATSSNKDKVNLRGSEVESPWFKVKYSEYSATDGKYNEVVGWVFGGGVRPTEFHYTGTDLGAYGSSWFSFEKVALADFEKAKSSHPGTLVRDTLQYVKGPEGLLILPLEGGKTHVFTDKTSLDDEAEYEEHTYLGHFEEIPYYVVEGNYYEDFAVDLLHRKTGKVTHLAEEPFLSPNKKRIATAYQAYGADADGFGFWSVVPPNDSLARDFYVTFSINDVYLQELYWETDGSIVFKTNNYYPDEAPNGNDQTAYWRLKLLK